MPKIALGRPGKPEGMYYTLNFVNNNIKFYVLCTDHDDLQRLVNFVLSWHQTRVATSPELVLRSQVNYIASISISKFRLPSLFR